MRHGVDAQTRPPRLAQSRAAALALGFAVAASGCYRYAYQERSATGPQGLIAIDRQQVEQRTAWSYFWGLQQADWAPDPLKCDGQGAGRVEVGFRWFTFPLLLLTLGMAVPNEVTVFCNTDAPPDEGP
jgi:hypothetical protein